MSGAEQKHRIRISLDIQSLKNNNFQGNVHVKHEEIRRMGISKFKTPSSLQLFKKHIEEQYFTDSFCSYEFDVAKEELLSLLREEKLLLETWHSDRLTKDRLIGKTVVPFTDIIKYPIKKTKQSYVRIFDSFHSIDQLDGEGNVLGKLGELRVIVYLEDLGPVGLLVNRNEEVVEVVAAQQEFQREADQVRIAGDQRADPGEFSKMPAEVALAEETIQQKAIIRELADIETKVIWELENWKRAEEARFRYNLKQKEADHIEKLRGEWRQKEIEREKVAAGHAGLQRGRNQAGGPQPEAADQAEPAGQAREPPRAARRRAQAENRRDLEAARLQRRGGRRAERQVGGREEGPAEAGQGARGEEQEAGRPHEELGGGLPAVQDRAGELADRGGQERAERPDSRDKQPAEGARKDRRDQRGVPQALRQTQRRSRPAEERARPGTRRREHQTRLGAPAAEKAAPADRRELHARREPLRHAATRALATQGRVAGHGEPGPAPFDDPAAAAPPGLPAAEHAGAAGAARVRPVAAGEPRAGLAGLPGLSRHREPGAAEERARDALEAGLPGDRPAGAEDGRGHEKAQSQLTRIVLAGAYN